MKPEQIKKRDQDVVEACLPPMMMFLMVEAAMKDGWEFRQDFHHHLNVASVVPMEGLDALSISRVAKKTDDAARALIRDLNADDSREALLSCACFVLVLVDEHYIIDPQSQAVLTALLLVDDANDDRADVHGNAVFAAREKKWRDHAKSMLRRAQLLGLYSRHPQPTTIVQV